MSVPAAAAGELHPAVGLGTGAPALPSTSSPVGRHVLAELGGIAPEVLDDCDRLRSDLTAALTEAGSIRRGLEGMGLPSRAPPIAPGRSRLNSLLERPIMRFISPVIAIAGRKSCACLRSARREFGVPSPPPICKKNR